jgi:hypothetical protein
MPLLDDDDPEVRVMAAALYASSVNPATAVSGELRARFDTETDPTTRGVLAEAALRAARRCGQDAAISATAAWAEELLNHSEPAIRFRIARAMLSHQPQGGREQRLTQIMTQAYQQAGRAAVWPAEV